VFDRLLIGWRRRLILREWARGRIDYSNARWRLERLGRGR
jgi:hypothetical protein